MAKSADVDGYVERLPAPQREICAELRRIIQKTFPGIEEGIRMGVPWYGKYYIVALRDSVNLGFSVVGLSGEDAANFSGKGRYMRHLKYRELGEWRRKRSCAS